MPAYKDKDRGTWYASFYYTDWSGNRKLKKKRGFKTKREALAWEAEFLRSAARSCDMTFASFVELYFDDMGKRLKPGTLHNKRYLFNARLLPFFGKLKMNEITPAHVRKWQSGLLAEGLAPTYARSIHNQLSALMNYAVRYYGLQSNPVRVAGSVGAKDADEMRFWTPEEFEAIVPYVKPVAARVGLSALFWTGLRIGELLALTPADIDFVKQTVSVTKSYQRLEGEDIIGPPKTKKSRRVVPLPDLLAEELRAYIASLYDVGPGDRIFPYTKHYFYEQKDAACARAGVEPIRLHDLRHSHASMLINKGLPVLLVSERLGHDDIETTLRTYGHLYRSTNTEAVDKLNELMSDLRSGSGRESAGDEAEGGDKTEPGDGEKQP